MGCNGATATADPFPVPVLAFLSLALLLVLAPRLRPRGRSSPNPLARLTQLASVLAIAAALHGCDGCGAADSPGPLEPDENTRFHIADRLGSSAMVLDSAGAVVARDGHLPYGERWFRWRAAGERGPSYSFTGQERDPDNSGVAIGARHYLPQLGRWISPDPLFLTRPQEHLERPAERNPFRYGGHNPVTHTDPTGLSIWTKLGKVVHKLRKGAKVADAFADTVQDVRTVLDPDASTAERVVAGLSLASEAFAVSKNDAKDILRGSRKVVRALLPGPLRRALPAARPVKGTWKPKGRFVGDSKGYVVDTNATKPGRYVQPDKSETDILQKAHHRPQGEGSAYSHTHQARRDVAPDGKVYTRPNKHPRAVTADEVGNIANGHATKKSSRNR